MPNSDRIPMLVPFAARVAASLLISCAVSTAASAQVGFGRELALPDAQKNREVEAADLVNVRVEANRASIGGGETIVLAVIFEIEPEWHIYWQNPGDAGAPTEIFVDAPDRFQIGPTLFARPHAFDEPEGTTFGYAGETRMLIPVTAPTGALPEKVEFELDVHYLVCKGRCLIGHAPLKFSIEGRRQGAESPPMPKSSVLETTASFPTRIAPARASFTSGGTFLVNDQGRFGIGGNAAQRRFVATLPAQGHRTAEFFPIDVPGVRFGAAEVQPRGTFIEISVPVTIDPQNATGPLALRGVIGLGRKQNDPSFVFDFAVERAEQGERQP